MSPTETPPSRTTGTTNRGKNFARSEALLSSADSVEQSRLSRGLAGVGLLLVLLGLANVLYGNHKMGEYSQLLSSALHELSSPNPSPFPLLEPTVNTDRQSQYIARLEASLDYYQFVRAGGWGIFISGFGLCAAAALVARKAVKQ